MKKHVMNDTDVNGNESIDKAMDQYFATVGKEMSKSCNHSKEYRQFLIAPTNNTMFLSPVGQQKVINEINRPAISKVSGIDNFPSNIVKLSCNFIYTPLTYICNVSFSEATVPHAIKVSKVIPVFKNGAMCLPGNY